uniref:ATP synthase complex subunit 8 n=1 Tax=Congrogadus subducens TaxID=1206929 RepID=A0A8F6H9H0_9TELE|nr:ATP synthase F0 subunit 8 [Congrogadus subducens]QXP99619.1 ATP synthase F0 subunit 8 [Congrogadus subducens]
MPQLDPSPWLFILVLSWSSFLIFIPPKLLAHTFPNEAETNKKHKSQTHPWNWQWH